MKLNTGQNGRFSLTIEAADLARGLRPSKRTPRNRGYLVECKGAVGRDKVLQVLDEFTRVDTSAINNVFFPFPQIFIFTNLTLICTQDTIYELASGSLTSKLSGLTKCSTWAALDFYDYIYLTNGKVAVTRDALSKVYSISATLPHGTALCNYNGQVLIGSPDVDANGADLTFPASTGTVTAAASGSI